jgi:phospholipid-binding lipoprotein MlaA
MERAATVDTDIALNVDFKAEEDRKAGPREETDETMESEINDPLEPLNRAFFVFNDKLYFWVLKPTANAYAFFVPEWGRTRVRNVFNNIKAPVRLVNALLQLKMHKFAAELSSFILNSTVGLAGLFDIAVRHPELNTSAEDLGQTFGSYGMGEGFYLVLPVLGPSSLRDTVGLAGDSFLDPVSYISPFRDEVAVRAFDQVNETSFRIGDYEDIKESALDPYISIKDIYRQYRRNKVRE